jgi:hypothetical protein
VRDVRTQQSDISRTDDVYDLRAEAGYLVQNRARVTPEIHIKLEIPFEAKTCKTTPEGKPHAAFMGDRRV